MRLISSVLLGLLSIGSSIGSSVAEKRSSYLDLDPEGIPPQHRIQLGLDSQNNNRFNLKAEPAATWNYKRNDALNGPATWATSGDPRCAGVAQSPIDIPLTATYDAKLPALKATFGIYKNITVVNNGHTVQVSAKTGDTSSFFSGGSLSNTYNVIQFHFHQVSEHTVGGAGFPAELHIVGLNADPLHQADTDPTQLAVLGLFLQENPDTNAVANPVFQSILTAAKKGLLTNIGNTANLDINMASLWQANNPGFWTYPGSLTSPNCRETVTWHVLRAPLLVSASQLYELRTYLSNDEAGNFNNRITMPLGSRVVRTNVPSSTINNPNTAANGFAPLAAATSTVLAFAVTLWARLF